MNKIIQNLKLKYKNKGTFEFLIVFLTFAFCLLTFPEHTFAQTASPSSQFIRISPIIFNLSLQPGLQRYETFTVENMTDLAVPTNLTFESFDTTSELGGYKFDSTQPKIAQWVDIKDKDFILDPHGKKEIQIHISIPSKVPLGGYYGMLFVNPLVADSRQNLKLAPKIGALFLANVGVPENQKSKIFILDFKFDNFISQNGNTNYLLRVQNTSLFHFTAKPVLYIQPIIGNQTKTYLEEKYIFPGKIRRWDIPAKLSNIPNIYKAVIKVSVGNGAQIQKDTYIIIFPYINIAIIAALILFSLYILTHFGKIKRAISILVFNRD